MRARPLLVLLAVAAAAPAAGATADPDAAAASRGDDGLLFDVRAGWGVPYGGVQGDAPLQDVADAKLPLAIAVGYRFGAHLRSVIYFELAPVSLAAPCPAGTSCSSFDVRFGLAAQVHLAPRAAVDPWIGVGFGIEHLQATAPPAGEPIAWDRSWLGLEVPVEVGLDVPLSEYFTLGPYVGVTAAQFTSATIRPPSGSSAPGEIEGRATHGWIQAGLKATLKL